MIPVLTVKSIKRSLSFYYEKLSFRIEEKYPDDLLIHRVLLKLGDQSLIIVARDSIGIEADEFNSELFTTRPGSGIQFRFTIEDADRFFERVSSYGVRVTRKPYDIPFPRGLYSGGMREFTLRDPDGYFLVFASSLPEKPQECLSCGMPLIEIKPSRLCPGCSDESGQLLPFGQILNHTIERLFISMLGLDRSRAEKAALDHLRRMPAWR